MLRREALVRTDVSEELRASFIRVTRICELGTTIAVAIPEGAILHSHRRENLKLYIDLFHSSCEGYTYSVGFFRKS
jgi:hypothetical protein